MFLYSTVSTLKPAHRGGRQRTNREGSGAGDRGVPQPWASAASALLQLLRRAPLRAAGGGRRVACWVWRAPMVGIVVTISPSFSLYRMVVLPAASRPTWRRQPGGERVCGRGGGWRLAPPPLGLRAAPRRTPTRAAQQGGRPAPLQPVGGRPPAGALRPGGRGGERHPVRRRPAVGSNCHGFNAARLRPQATGQTRGRRVTRHQDAHLALAEQLREQLRGDRQRAKASVHSGPTRGVRAHVLQETDLCERKSHGVELSHAGKRPDELRGGLLHGSLRTGCFSTP